MRAIHITGKHNIDKMNKIGDGNYKAVRKAMLQVEEIDHNKQMNILREMATPAEYVPALESAALESAALVPAPVPMDEIKKIQSLFKSELIHKIQGYKGQDIKKDIHQPETLINLEQVLEKLVACHLQCVYCSKPVFILYKNVREPTQWTLDRIDNDLSHTAENTCIACLKCNLQRRLIDNDKFTFTKKLKLKKV